MENFHKKLQISPDPDKKKTDPTETMYCMHALPGLVLVAPGSGVMIWPPVSVCQ